MILSTIWLGVIGFIDDYLKLRAKTIAQQQGLLIKKEIRTDWRDGLK